MSEIVTKKEALAAGLNRYFTGEPCNNGHVCERYVNRAGNRYKVGCVECRDDFQRSYRRMPGFIRRNRDNAARLGRRGVSLKNLPPPIRAGHCDLCERAKTLHWDHDHALAALGYPPKACHRGWLCVGCNTSLGGLGDDVAGLTRALIYVSRTAPK